MHKVYNEAAPATFLELFSESLSIRIQKGFRNCITVCLKQIFLNVSTEFQAEEG